MFISNAIGRSWRSLLAAFERSDHQTLLAIMCDVYWIMCDVYCAKVNAVRYRR